MNFLRKLLGRPPAQAESASKLQSQLPASTQPKGSAPSANAKRRELLRVVLRNVLHRHGIPPDWIGAEWVASTSRSREPGIHLRLLIRHWDPRLLAHAVALENAFVVRLLTLDPLASNWLAGISWQFALADESACPALPPAEFWTAQRSQPAATRTRSELDKLIDSQEATGPEGQKTQPLHLKTQPTYASTEPMPLDALPPVRS